MLNSRYYDRQGQEITYRRYRDLMENVDYTRVALDTVNAQDVSTVWLGLDHNFNRGWPAIFETMILGEGEYALECRRYPTESDALKGHYTAVANLQAGRAPW